MEENEPYRDEYGRLPDRARDEEWAEGHTDRVVRREQDASTAADRRAKRLKGGHDGRTPVS